jgi:ABC-type multidrug transport system fused ATPase/permease subunit
VFYFALSFLLQAITNFRTVRSFAAEEKELQRFRKALDHILRIGYMKAGGQGFGIGLITGWCYFAHLPMEATADSLIL